MNNQPLVSVIIPVYGVEKYIATCLESIVNQTYENLEILVIDDESPDQSGAIAEGFAEKDPRIKVLHIKNRGAAGARNVGLDSCTGDYVVFVDSDDWVSSDFIEKLYNAAEENNCEIAQCQFTNEYLNKSECQNYQQQKAILSHDRYMENYIHTWEYVLIWNKIIKWELLDGIRMVEGRCIDDEFFTYRFAMNAERIALIPDYLYHYRIRKSSAMGSTKKRIQRLKDQLDFVTDRYGILITRYPRLKVYLLEHMLELYMTVMRNSTDLPEIYKEAKTLLKQYWMEAKTEAVDSGLRKSVILYLMKRRVSAEKTREIEVNDAFE